MEMSEDYVYDVALRLVKEAGAAVKDAFAKPRSAAVETKASDVDLVTETDRLVEKMLFDGLAKHFPDHKFIGEETVSDGGKIEFTDAPTWIIDPIDGTTNFVHRYPHICICVGWTVQKVVRLGIVYNPVTDELYTARLGRGAYKNGFKLRTSNAKTVCKALIAGSFGMHNLRVFPNWMDVVTDNWRRLFAAGIRGQRSSGSCAINMVLTAEGCVDAYAEYGVHCWDLAAASLIVTEAGGVVVDPNTAGQLDLMRRCLICASSAELAQELSKLLTHVEFPPEG